MGVLVSIVEQQSPANKISVASNSKGLFSFMADVAQWIEHQPAD